jgi:hypothetical protein
MHAAIALFDPTGAGWVERLWENLEKNFGLTGYQWTPVVHFSWDVFFDLDEDLVGACLARRAEGMAPFEVKVSGLGVFPGANPTIYLNVVKDAHLLQLHGSLHEELSPGVIRRSPLYAPNAWVPHVSLIHHENDLPLLARAIADLLRSDLPDSLRVKALGWIKQNSGEPGKLAARFDLKG